jgi:hypothetical protein
MIVVVVGAFLKITHLPFASGVLAVGMLAEFASIIAIIVLLLTKKTGWFKPN